MPVLRLFLTFFKTPIRVCRHLSLRPGESNPQSNLTDDDRPIARLLRDAVSAMCTEMLATKAGAGGDPTGSPEHALSQANAILQSPEYAELKAEMLGRLGAGVKSIVADLDGKNGSSFGGSLHVQQMQRGDDMYVQCNWVAPTIFEPATSEISEPTTSE